MAAIVRPRSLSLMSLLLLLALPPLAGCGSSGTSGNGVSAKSAPEIVRESKSAADAATSVHVAGALKSGSSPVRLDLDLVAGKGARGEISQNGTAFKLIIVGDTAYISGSPAFYRSLGGAAAAQLFDGKWLKAPATKGDFASIGSLVDMRKLLDTTLTAHGTLVKGSTSRIGGQQAIAVTDTSKDGTLYVATTGKPFPLQIAKGGSENGKITFDRWNQAVTITAPANAVNLAELKSLGGH
jgi:hypothetical protein